MVPAPGLSFSTHPETCTEPLYKAEQRIRERRGTAVCGLQHRSLHHWLAVSGAAASPPPSLQCSSERDRLRRGRFRLRCPFFATDNFGNFERRANGASCERHEPRRAMCRPFRFQVPRIEPNGLRSL